MCTWTSDPPLLLSSCSLPERSRDASTWLAVTDRLFIKTDWGRWMFTSGSGSPHHTRSDGSQGLKVITLILSLIWGNTTLNSHGILFWSLNFKIKRGEMSNDSSQSLKTAHLTYRWGRTFLIKRLLRLMCKLQDRVSESIVNIIFIHTVDVKMFCCEWRLTSQRTSFLPWDH